MAASAGTQAYSTHRSNKERDAISADNIRKQMAHQRRIDDRVKQNLNQLETSSPEAERAQSLNNYLSQLRAARAAASGTPGAPGSSSRYQRDTETSDASIQNYGRRVADSLSRINSAGLQRQNERIGTGRMAADVGGISRQASGDDAIARMRIAAVQDNPWLTGLSLALRAAAAATSMGAGGAAGAGSTGGTGAGMGASTSGFSQTASSLFA